MRDPILIEVRDTSAIGEARRVASALADRIGLPDVAIARLALIVTELGTNLVKHASGGTFLLGGSNGSGGAFEVLALDAGPGIPNLAEALRDGHSTAGTPGTGLGAIARQADLFQVYSQPTQGTAIFARVTPVRNQQADLTSSGAVSVPFPGETVSGDAWAEKVVNGRRTILVVDGLGHGELAHDAAVAACKAFRTASGSVCSTLTTVHDALRGTRGAAVAIAELDPESGSMRFTGVGNISATVVDPAARRSAVSLYGIVGHQMREPREYVYPWTPESTLIMHSDGLTTRWDLDRYPGLLGRDVSLIAGVLWKDHHRQTDDSIVVVARTR